MGNEVFLDTAYAIALSSPKDNHHEAAARLAADIKRQIVRMVTTSAVVTEIGDSLSKAIHRAAAVRLIRSIEQDNNITVIHVDAELLERAFELFANRPDKEWGLTDCISFVVMGDHEIADALTADKHFEQAGFRALLRES